MSALDGVFDVTGRVIVITGGDKGLGFQTAKKLVRGGGIVVITTRDPSLLAAEGATAHGAKRAAFLSRIGEIYAANIHLLYADLSSLASVKQLAVQLAARFPAIDCLICNAGVMAANCDQLTADGFELHFGVNHLAHFHLILLIMELLRASRSPRLVMVSSILLKKGSLNIDNVRQLTSRSAAGRNPPEYANSKLMNALIAREVHRRYPEIAVFCVSPGLCRTDLGKKDGKHDIPWHLVPLAAIPLLLFSHTAEEGCDSIVYAAASNKALEDRGKFMRSRSVVPDIETFLDTFDAQALWQFSLDQLQLGN